MDTNHGEDGFHPIATAIYVQDMLDRRGVAKKVK